MVVDPGHDHEPSLQRGPAVQIEERPLDSLLNCLEPDTSAALAGAAATTDDAASGSDTGGGGGGGGASSSSSSSSSFAAPASKAASPRAGGMSAAAILERSLEFQFLSMLDADAHRVDDWFRTQKRYLRQQLAILEQQSRELKAADAKIEKEIRTRIAITPSLAAEGADPDASSDTAGPRSARARNSRAARPDEHLLHRASTQPNLLSISEQEVQAARAALMHRDHADDLEESKSDDNLPNDSLDSSSLSNAPTSTSTLLGELASPSSSAAPAALLDLSGLSEAQLLELSELRAMDAKLRHIQDQRDRDLADAHDPASREDEDYVYASGGGGAGDQEVHEDDDVYRRESLGEEEDEELRHEAEIEGEGEGVSMTGSPESSPSPMVLEPYSADAAAAAVSGGAGHVGHSGAKKSPFSSIMSSLHQHLPRHMHARQPHSSQSADGSPLRSHSPASGGRTLGHSIAASVHSLASHGAHGVESLHVHARLRMRLLSSRKPWETLRVAYKELYRGIQLLRDFKMHNYTAFVKILKKHDKLSPSLHLHAKCMSRLNALHVFASSELHHLQLQVEAVFARDFNFGNRKQALGALKPTHTPMSHLVTFRLGLLLGLSLALLVVLFFLAHFVALRTGTAVSVKLTPVLPVYRGLFLVILHLWLWGLNVHLFRRTRINYQFIFEIDPKSELAGAEVLQIAALLTFMWFTSLDLYLATALLTDYFPDLVPGYFHLALYMVILLGALCPFDVLARNTRAYTARTLFHILTTGWGPVAFRDFYTCNQVLDRNECNNNSTRCKVLAP